MMAVTVTSKSCVSCILHWNYAHDS